MNKEEFKNKAYEIATGNCLTETFNKEKYDSMNEEEVFVYVWEPFENLSSGELCSQIEQIANDIINLYTEEDSKQEDFGFIINDKALYEDTIEGIMNITEDTGLTEEQVREYMDENEMSNIVEAMYEAQSNEIQNIKDKILEHYNLGDLEDEDNI